MYRSTIPVIILLLIMVISCSEDKVVDIEPEEETLLNKVSVASDTVSAGTKFSIDVYIENNEPLAGIVIPLEYPGENITLDSISLMDTRFEDYVHTGTVLDSESRRMAFYVYASGNEVIDTGRGTACHLYFWVWGNSPTQDIVIDSVFIPQSLYISFMDTTYNRSFVPDFESGLLHINGMIDAVGDSK
jgi:hypothetical protein